MSFIYVYFNNKDIYLSFYFQSLFLNWILKNYLNVKRFLAQTDIVLSTQTTHKFNLEFD